MSKVLVSLPDPLLKRVDRVAKSEHRNRSQVTREALEQWLEFHEHFPPKNRPGAADAMMVMERISRGYKAPKGGIVKAIRKSREGL